MDTVFRKIINNKWMMLCLLFGFIVVVAMGQRRANVFGCDFAENAG